MPDWPPYRAAPRMKAKFSLESNLSKVEQDQLCSFSWGPLPFQINGELTFPPAFHAPCTLLHIVAYILIVSPLEYRPDCVTHHKWNLLCSLNFGSLSPKSPDHALQDPRGLSSWKPLIISSFSFLIFAFHQAWRHVLVARFCIGCFLWLRHYSYRGGPEFLT